MSILNDDDLNRFSQSVFDTLGDAIAQGVVYQLGKEYPDGSREIKRPGGRRGEVWVRLPGQDSGAAVPAINVSLGDDDLVYGNYVKVKREKGQLVIMGRALESAEYLARVPIRPQRLIDVTQLNYGLIIPKSTMSVTVTAAFRLADNTMYYQPPLDSKDFTSDRPVVSNMALGVWIEIDPTTNTLYYTNSSTWSLTLSLKAAFEAGNLTSTVTSGRSPVGWVKLYYNQITIERSDILPAVGLISSGGSSNIDPAQHVWSSFLVNTVFVSKDGNPIKLA